MIRLQPAEDDGLALAAIQIDGGTQSRATLNEQVVSDYAEAIKAGATFPPIIVFYDGKKHWLADGFHRFHAYQKAGRTTVNADVRQGTRRDAILHSVGANETHGLRRTRDDKRRAVETLLNDAEWGKWSDGEIAKRCAVSREYVNRLRPVVTCDQVTSERTYITKHGTTATMKTAGINASRKNAPKALVNDEPSPEAGPQAEASLVGTDTGTLADREGRLEGEAASVDLPTVSDDIDAIRAGHITQYHVMQLRSAWSKANAQARAIFLAEIKSSDGMASGSEHHSADHVSPPASQAAMGSGSANAGGEDVTDDDSANTINSPSKGKTSLAAREGEKPLHSNSPSDDDAFAAVTGKAQLANAAGVEPSSSDNPSASPRAEAVADPQASQAPKATATSFNPDPQTPGVATADPADQASQHPAQNDDVPHVVGQGGLEPVVHCGDAVQEPASSPQGRNEPASGVSASVTFSKRAFVLRPHCLRPELCAGSGANHCHACKKAMAEGEAA